MVVYIKLNYHLDSMKYERLLDINDSSETNIQWVGVQMITKILI